MTHMALVLIGTLLILVGVVSMAGQPLWRGPLSGGKRTGAPSDTLEPQTPIKGFGIKIKLARSRALRGGCRSFSCCRSLLICWDSRC